MFCNEIASQYDVTVEFVHGNVPATLPDSIALNVFRVLQEALSNAVKHSGASRYRVSLRGTEAQLQLEVTDNGRGFDTAVPTSGLGLVTMQERIGLVHGDLAIESRQESGTTVLATVPLQPNVAPRFSAVNTPTRTPAGEDSAAAP
jgi:signal transduction histidine kinase